MTLDQWLAAYDQAWHGKDDHALTDLITADDLYRSSPTQPPHRGRQAIAAYGREANTGQADLKLRFGTPAVTGDPVVTEWRATMGDTSPSDGDAPTNAMTLPGALSLRFSTGGRWPELRDYHDPVLGSTISAPIGGYP